jgi:hypothetical protein
MTPENFFPRPIFDFQNATPLRGCLGAAMRPFSQDATRGSVADRENTPNPCLGAGRSGVAFRESEKRGGRRVLGVEGRFSRMKRTGAISVFKAGNRG